MFTPASLGHGRRGACCRRARFEDGIDRFTLRFADPMREDGFAHAHKAPLCNYTTLAMVALVASSFLGGLIAHRFWDNAQYPTAEARELSRWQLRIGMMMTTPCALALGSGILLARYNIISTLGLEIIVVSASTCYMIVMVIIPKHYMARLFGHGDPEDIWGVDLGGTDGQTVLYIDCVVTALHLLLPIRWMILFPMEVIAVLAYTVPALLLGSPAMNMVPYNVMGLLLLTVFAAIGRRSFERQERLLFAGLLLEKQMRFQAEFELSKLGKLGSREAAVVSDRGSDEVSCPGTTMSAAAFDGGAGHASLDQIRSIGQREHWLIGSGEVELLADRVLGVGGFGIVAAGLYHNTLVAVKAPKQDILRRGAMGSSLPELCNELRVLRRIRHPNIAFLYGACMDAALSKLSLVLEFVDGVPLGAFVSGMHPHAEGPEARGPPASASARCLIVSDILNVLRYLHSRQPVIVHGDLKDSNVFVEERRGRGGQIWYHAKLLDFGLSRLVTRRAVPLGGTLRWMAPELLTGVAVPPAAAADLYSFGLLAYFIVTGRRPFEGASRDRVLRRLRRGQPPSLAWPVPAADLSRACRPVVEQCTQPRPSLRPTAQQVSDELSGALNPAVGESMDTMLESCTGRSGCGSRKLSFATEFSAAGSSDGKEFLESSGVVEVRQAVSASHRSLMAGTSQSLPVVQEHATLQSREAPGGAEAAPSSSPATAQQATLLHPEYELTPLRTQTLTLAYLLLQWNVAAAPGGSCCWLHSALLALDTAREELQRRPCNVPQSGTVCGQCDTCGLLLTHGQSFCEFCEAPEASSTEADLTHSADVFGI